MTDAVVSEISEAIKACATIEQVNECKIKYREHMKLLDADPRFKVRAIHIRSLARYLIADLRSKGVG